MNLLRRLVRWLNAEPQFPDHAWALAARFMGEV